MRIEESEHYTQGQLSAWFELDSRTLAAAIEAGQLKGVRAGAAGRAGDPAVLLFKGSEILRWLAAGAPTSRASAAGGTQPRAAAATVTQHAPATGESAQQEFDRMVNARVSRGEDRVSAARAVFAEHPALREQMVREANADRPRVLERLQRSGASAAAVSATAATPTRAASPPPPTVKVELLSAERFGFLYGLPALPAAAR